MSHFVYNTEITLNITDISSWSEPYGTISQQTSVEPIAARSPKSLHGHILTPTLANWEQHGPRRWQPYPIGHSHWTVPSPRRVRRT